MQHQKQLSKSHR